MREVGEYLVDSLTVCERRGSDVLLWKIEKHWALETTLRVLVGVMMKAAIIESPRLFSMLKP